MVKMSSHLLVVSLEHPKRRLLLQSKNYRKCLLSSTPGSQSSFSLQTRTQLLDSEKFNIVSNAVHIHFPKLGLIRKIHPQSYSNAS